MHIGWIVALVLVVLLYIYLRHSKQGYELTVVGENEATARYAGIPVWEYACTAIRNGREEPFLLQFYPERCEWKIYLKCAEG